MLEKISNRNGLAPTRNHFITFIFVIMLSLSFTINEAWGQAGPGDRRLADDEKKLDQIDVRSVSLYSNFDDIIRRIPDESKNRIDALCIPYGGGGWEEVIRNVRLKNQELLLDDLKSKRLTDEYIDEKFYDFLKGAKESWVSLSSKHCLPKKSLMWRLTLHSQIPYGTELEGEWEFSFSFDGLLYRIKSTIYYETLSCATMKELVLGKVSGTGAWERLEERNSKFFWSYISDVADEKKTGPDDEIIYSVVCEEDSGKLEINLHRFGWDGYQGSTAFREIVQSFLQSLADDIDGGNVKSTDSPNL